MPVRQYENVRRFEIDLRVLIRNELRPEQDSARIHLAANCFPDSLPVFLAVFGPAGDYQTVISPPGLDITQRRHKVFNALVGRDMTEKQKRFLSLADPQSSLRLAHGEAGNGNRIVDSVRDDANPPFVRAE